MSRKLVVLCDGTFNDSSSHTNVFRFKNKLARPGQRVYYDEGVGVTEEGTTKGNLGGLVDRLAGGAVGSGISGNVQQAYRWVCNNYEDGDELYFLGFSRGAFTARSVVGMIRKVGLIRGDIDARTLRRAYARYRDEHHPKCRETRQFRELMNARPVERITLRFLGVWDTVGALGMPVVGPRSFIARRRWGFHDTQLSSHVEIARQALAVDERRAAFLPALWWVEDEGRNWNVEQRWFAGCHSDIGGRHGQIAFDWLAGEARKAGLAFDPDLLEPPVERPPQLLHESLSGTYKFLVGAARRPIREPRCANQPDRFIGEEIDPSAWKLRVSNRGRVEDLALDRRPNLRRAGKARGAELGWGLFVGSYNGQYEDQRRPRPPCRCWRDDPENQAPSAGAAVRAAAPHGSSENPAP